MVRRKVGSAESKNDQTQSEETLTAVAAHIEKIGAGPYQFQQALLVACFFLSEAAELDVISPLTTAWRLEWALVTDQVAALASVGFLGFALGTFLSGIIGDRFGRRVPILFGYIGVLLGAFGMSTAGSPIAVGVFRALTGASVGLGIPASLTLIAEITPAKDRGTLLSLCYAALAIGALYADLGLYFFLPDLQSGDWRSLCIWSAVPAAVALPIGFLALEDTPCFFVLQKDATSVSRVLNTMAERNNKSDIRWQAPDLIVSKPESVEHMPSNAQTGAESALAKSTVSLVACAALDFAYNFVGFGTGYFFPLAISEVAASAPIPPVGELVLANLLAFPGLYLAYSALNSKFGHKQVLGTACCIEVSACVLLMLNGLDALPVIGIFILKLTMGTFSQTVNAVKSELFPSNIRVTALSISGTCGRMGALLAPAIIEETRGAPGAPGEFDFFVRCIMTVLCVATLLGVSLLPETKGKQLPS